VAEAATFRRKLYVQLDPLGWTRPGLSPLNRALVVLILLAVGTAIIETEPDVYNRSPVTFQALNLLFFKLFAVEYLARLWVCVERDNGLTEAQNRWAFLRSPWSLLDLLVLAVTIAPFLGSNFLILRLLRILRIASLARHGRLAEAMGHLRVAISARKFELLLTLGLASGLIVFGATALFWIEGHIQPDKFGSIPRALWWSVVTFTTIGYGDVSPVTPLGKIVAGLVAVAAIGLVAMPTGILAAAFSDAMQRRREEGESDHPF
jgi:voltage-gated potassium channel